MPNIVAIFANFKILKMKKAGKSLLVILTICLFLLPQLSHAKHKEDDRGNDDRSEQRGNGRKDDDGGRSAAVPIDGSLVLLAIAGTIYMVVKARKFKSKKLNKTIVG